MLDTINLSRNQEPMLSSDVSERWGERMETNMASSSDNNPLHHTQNMKKHLQETVDHLRQDIGKVDDPQFKAMFETSAEVLVGLIKAFGDYEKKNEAAWRK
jgi:hypothetical protein